MLACGMVLISTAQAVQARSKIGAEQKAPPRDSFNLRRWLLPEGRKVIQPDGAHPTAVPGAYRGRRALQLAAPQHQQQRRQQQPAYRPASGSIAGSDDQQPDPQQQQQRQVNGLNAPEPWRHSGVTELARRRQLAADPAAAAATGASQITQADSPAAQPSEALLPDGSPAEGRAGSANATADARRRFREEAEAELGWDEEGPAGASDEEAALERKSASTSQPRCNSLSG